LQHTRQRTTMYRIQRTRLRRALLKHILAPRHTALTPPLLQDLRGNQLRAREHNRHACARMRASADEIQILDRRMLSLWPETQHVEERVAQAEDSAAVEVELVFPRRRRVDDLVDDVGFERDLEALLHDCEDGFARAGDHGGPVLRRAVVVLTGGLRGRG
jgi:hypothetical protein